MSLAGVIHADVALSPSHGPLGAIGNCVDDPMIGTVPVGGGTANV